ncbi:MAG TPA: MSMEG_4193 family putative phosphomutase [Actinomycetota bacterium]|nr:MSMEG_4193 family putative phosphomutase [Actinomycetota bacterium]
MLLLLIRHGLTAHTGVKLSGWTPGIPLSEVGRAQAEKLVERFAGLAVDAVYSSPLDRTWQTAGPLARERKLKITKRTEIGEVRYGDMEGKALRTLAKGPLWRKLNAWPSDVRFPNGESLRETQTRAVAAIERLRSEHPGKTVAVFSHGDWIRLAMAHYSGMHIDLYRRLSIDPVSVSALQFHEMGVLVRRVNDTGALGDLSSSQRPAAARARSGRS